MNSKKSPKVLPIFIMVLVIAAAIAIYAIVDGFRSNSANAASGLVDSEYVITLDSDNFDRIVSEGLVLVDFWATWCAPCRIQGPIIEELAREVHQLAHITKLDVDDHSSIAERFGVRSIPTLILFKDGEAVERFMGVQQKESLMAAINKHL